MYRAAASRALVRHIGPPLVALLRRTGLSPNQVTLLGLALAGGSAYLVSTGHFLAGGLVLAASGAMDILDGLLAKLTAQTTRFGAVLDSVVDRVGEAAVLLGLLVFYLNPASRAEIILIFLTLGASFMVSYLRAKAEGLGIPCSVGIMTRPERVFLLAVGLMIDQVAIILGIIAALAILTSGQRMLHIWNATKVRVDN